MRWKQSLEHPVLHSRWGWLSASLFLTPRVVTYDTQEGLAPLRCDLDEHALNQPKGYDLIYVRVSEGINSPHFLDWPPFSCLYTYNLGPIFTLRKRWRRRRVDCFIRPSRSFRPYFCITTGSLRLQTNRSNAIENSGGAIVFLRATIQKTLRYEE